MSKCQWRARVERAGHRSLPAVAVCLLGIAIAVPAAAQEQRKGEEFTCLVQPKLVLKLGTPVPGLISDMLVDRGTIVKKGDVIARLESSVEQAALALAEERAQNDSTVRSSQAKLEFQDRRADRARELKKYNNIALSAADEAETAAEVAKIEDDEAQVN